VTAPAYPLDLDTEKFAAVERIDVNIAIAANAIHLSQAARRLKLLIFDPNFETVLPGLSCRICGEREFVTYTVPSLATVKSLQRLFCRGMVRLFAIARRQIEAQKVTLRR